MLLVTHVRGSFFVFRTQVVLLVLFQHTQILLDWNQSCGCDSLSYCQQAAGLATAALNEAERKSISTCFNEARNGTQMKDKLSRILGTKWYAFLVAKGYLD